MTTSRPLAHPPNAQPAGENLLGLVCTACAISVEIDRASGTAAAADGSRRSVMYADDALLVWACPGCDYPQAEDLTS